MAGREVEAARALGAFHVHRGHDFEGFESRRGTTLVVARCACAADPDLADAGFAPPAPNARPTAARARGAARPAE